MPHSSSVVHYIKTYLSELREGENKRAFGACIQALQETKFIFIKDILVMSEHHGTQKHLPINYFVTSFVENAVDLVLSPKASG